MKNKTPGNPFFTSQTTMHHKDLLQLVFLKFEAGHDMLNFSEINRKCNQVFQQQIKINDDQQYDKIMKNIYNQRHGICRVWRLTGQLYYEHNYYQGQLHGSSRGWWLNGQLMCEHNYLHSQRHGISRGWTENGKLWYKHNYIHGQTSD